MSKISKDYNGMLVSVKELDTPILVTHNNQTEYKFKEVIDEVESITGLKVQIVSSLGISGHLSLDTNEYEIEGIK